jgi:hypothetical protein
MQIHCRIREPKAEPHSRPQSRSSRGNEELSDEGRLQSQGAPLNSAGSGRLVVNQSYKTWTMNTGIASNRHNTLY